MQWLWAAWVSGFCAGILSSDPWRGALWAGWAWGAWVAWALASCCARGRWGEQPWPWLALGGALLGAALHLGAQDPGRARPQAWRATEEVPGDLQGEVIRGSRAGAQGRHSVTIQAALCDERPCHGRWRVSLPPEAPWLRRGDVVRLAAVIYPPGLVQAPYLFDAARWSRSQGLVGGASVRDAAFVELLREGQGPGAWLDAARHRREDWVARSLGPRAGPVLAILTGTRGLISPERRAPVDAAGLSHLLAISGLHLMALWAWLRRVLGWLSPRRWPAWWVELAAVGAVLLFGAFVGWPVSARRAAVMMLCWRGAAVASRRHAMAPALSLAVWVVLLLEGTDALYGPGLHLSVSAVVGLKLASGRAGAGRLWEGARITLGASAACTPWVLWHFGRLPLLGLGLNLVAVPLVELVALPMAALAMLLGPGLGRWPLEAAGWTLWAIEWMAQRCPWAGADLGLASAAPLLLGLALAAALLWWRRPRAALVAVALSGLAAGLWPVRGPARAIFLPVGQGDAILLVDGQGHTVLMDTGGSVVGGQDPGERVLRPALLRLGVHRLDVVVISHADLDHIMGLELVLRRFRPRQLWWSPHPEEGPREARLLALARELGVEVVAPPWEAQVGAIRLRRLDRPSPGLSKNDASVVLEAELEGLRLLLTGDVEAQGEARLLERLRPVHVLKAAHHGSRTSSTEAFLERARPTWVLIQAGRGNRYGHPHTEVVRRYLEHGARVYDGRDCGQMTLWAQSGVMILDSAAACRQTIEP